MRGNKMTIEEERIMDNWIEVFMWILIILLAIILGGCFGLI